MDITDLHYLRNVRTKKSVVVNRLIFTEKLIHNDLLGFKLFQESDIL